MKPCVIGTDCYDLSNLSKRKSSRKRPRPYYKATSAGKNEVGKGSSGTCSSSASHTLFVHTDQSDVEFLDESVSLDEVTAYGVELNKARGITAVDCAFTSFAVEGFCRNTRQLEV